MINKIFFYVPSFQVSVGGAEVQASRLAKELQTKQKVNVHIVSLSGAYIFDQDGVLSRVEAFTQKTPRSISSRIKNIINAIFYILNNKDSDLLVHFHTLSPNALIIGLILKVICLFSHNITCVYKVTRTGCDSPLRQYLKPSIGFLLFKLQLLISSKFISLTPAGNQELLKSGVLPENIFLIPNGINLPKPKDRVEWKSRKNIYIVIGRAIKRKCLPQIINAWLNANRKKDAELLIIGDGPELLELKRHYNTNLKKHNIKFLGHQEHASILKRLITAKYYVSASVSEGLSNSLLEGMASGLVPIIKKIPENEFVVEHKNNGFLFSTENELRNLFSSSIKIENEEKLSKNGFRMIKDNFDIKQIADRYRQFIIKVAAK